MNRTVTAPPRDSTRAVRATSTSSSSLGRPGMMPVRSPCSRISSIDGGSAAAKAAAASSEDDSSACPATDSAPAPRTPTSRRLGEHRLDGGERRHRARRAPRQDLERRVGRRRPARLERVEQREHGPAQPWRPRAVEVGARAGRTVPASSRPPTSHGVRVVVSQTVASAAHRCSTGLTDHSSSATVGTKEDDSSPSSATRPAAAASSTTSAAVRSSTSRVAATRRSSRTPRPPERSTPGGVSSHMRARWATSRTIRSPASCSRRRPCVEMRVG